ncbi:MAG: hypothetical protein DSY33_03805 [Archaeoglobus sp.]|jgi:DNA-directed RNA polymerase subunit F|nr:MAG: hypothetical protein DSY33_03805 [Archaeoglobus sp.]
MKLKNRKDKIATAWKEALLSGYAVKPMVEIEEYIESCTKRIMDYIDSFCKGENSNVDIVEAVDDLMRYLATDSKLGPGDSIRQILYLKNIALKVDPKMSIDEFVRFSNAVDEVACLAFNKYMEAKEHIYLLRVKEKEGLIDMLRKAMSYYEKYYGELPE